ncbi:MAG: hypothetical protein JW737_05180 [Acidobacteria bacterium]|nr:hypothetical protein [Acidobacteriota bacterium]
MAITEKSKTLLAISLFVIFVISLIYNLSKDPRNLYEKGDSPREELIEQQKQRAHGIIKDEKLSIINLDLLKSRSYTYDSSISRNIFKYGDFAKKETTPEIVKPKTLVQENKPPIIQQPEIIKPRSPFDYVGYAQTDGKDIAIIQGISDNKIHVICNGMYFLSKQYKVEEITKKKIVLKNTVNQELIEISRKK